VAGYTLIITLISNVMNQKDITKSYQTRQNKSIHTNTQET